MVSPPRNLQESWKLSFLRQEVAVTESGWISVGWLVVGLQLFFKMLDC